MDRTATYLAECLRKANETVLARQGVESQLFIEAIANLEAGKRGAKSAARDYLRGFNRALRKLGK